MTIWSWLRRYFEVEEEVDVTINNPKPQEETWSDLNEGNGYYDKEQKDTK